MKTLVLVVNGFVMSVEYDKDLLSLSREIGLKNSIVAKVNNQLQDLSFRVKDNCRIEYLGIEHEEGNRVYRRSLCFVLIKAVRDLFPSANVRIEHSLSKGLYCEIHMEQSLNEEIVNMIKRRMQEIVNKDIPFIREIVNKEKAMQLFTREAQEDKVRLLQHYEEEKIILYSLEGMYDYFYGPMVPSTGYLKAFNLIYYMSGVILQYPTVDQPERIPEFVEQRKLAVVFQESERWAKILEVSDVGLLNEAIMQQRGREIIRVAEALHEKRIAEIADLIAKERERIHVILIAGPSSSGKTTFAQRLAVQLRVNGLRPISISTDDYYVNRELTPLDEEGKPDFESIEAIDLQLFNNDLAKLIQGEEVALPTFNFVTGKREYSGGRIRVAPDQPVIIEGIHGLNERLTADIPKEHKFKIYISALTQLNLDHHNRIPTTDVRLLRRIVRDSQFRSYDALQTIQLWPSVRKGEEKNIFPFQEEADIMFNSALVYELSVIKSYAETYLKKIDPSHAAYSEAERLLKLLSYFLPLEDAEGEIPPNSILREFIGNSCFVEKR